jgi:hypothetical protein
MEKETLKEAAERLASTTDEFNMFIAGTKWQAERMYDDVQLYSEIEHLIITWNIDGTLTAGALTRQIIEHIKKK